MHEQNIENTDRTLRQLLSQIQDVNDSLENGLKKKEDIAVQIEKLQVSLKDAQAEKSNMTGEIESLGFTTKKLSGLEDIIELVQTQQKSLHGDRMKLLTKEEEISKRINKSKQLIDQGKCPTCGQDLHGSAMHETILSDKEHLASLKNELVAISKKEEEFDLKMEQLKQIKAVSKRMEDCDDLIRSSSETIDMYQKRLLDHVSRIDDDNKRLNEAVSLKQKMMADVTQQKEQEQLLQEAVSISIKKHAEA